MSRHPNLLPARRRRVAFYSHDTQGLGHTRRNVAIAAALVAARRDIDVLLLTGAPEATMLPLPPCTEVLTLPTLRKCSDGRYSPRVLTASLDDVLQMRSRLIETALTSFEPDLFVVDKVARGVGGELDRALTGLRRAGATRTVLGLRDVLDAPGVARREWRAARATEAVRELYDEVWVYGDPSVYDSVFEYSLPFSVARKVSYTGYLAGARPACLQPRYEGAGGAAPPSEPFALCLVGGGQDGVEIARAFLRAPLPAGHQGVVLTGPYMRPELRRELLQTADLRRDMTVHEFVADTQEFVARAAATVSMGGYNSVCELLGSGCPTLVVPRVSPRAEQALRAELLARAGWIDVLPSASATPTRLGAWLSTADVLRLRPRSPIDLGGLARIPELADRLLGTGVLAEEAPHVAV